LLELAEYVRRIRVLTYTYVTMEVPPEMFEWFAKKLRNTGYESSVEEDVIDMHGIALIPEPQNGESHD